VGGRVLTLEDCERETTPKHSESVPTRTNEAHAGLGDVTGVLAPLEKKAPMPNRRRAFLALLPGTLIGQEPGTVSIENGDRLADTSITWTASPWSGQRHGRLPVDKVLAFPTSDGEAVRCLQCLGDLVASYTPPLERAP